MVHDKQFHPWREDSLFHKIRHCIDGFHEAMTESSFRFVFTYTLILQVMVVCTAPTLADKGMALFVTSLPPAFEFVNSAIERACDVHGMGHNDMIKKSKDVAGAASMYAQVVATLAGMLIMCSNYIEYTASALSVHQYFFATFTS